MTMFRRRVLLVESDEELSRVFSAALREQGYELLAVHDGFEALQILRGAVPDLLITELTLPRMSGFELLSVVRKRFPQIGVIATSDEYNAATLPAGTIADAFVAKGPNASFELTEAALNLVRESPVRSSQSKANLAPVWIPRSTAGYIILTRPECMRSFSITPPNVESGKPVNGECLFCGANIRFQMSATTAGEPEKKLVMASPRAESARLIAQSRRLSEESKRLRRWNERK